MQVVVAVIALPLVALLLVLASRLEDGLRTAASSGSPLALPPGPLAVVEGLPDGVLDAGAVHAGAADAQARAA